ncbi:gamma-glutamylcyclotransferase [Gymnodinialimonas sp. 2305UL16-5]|uniref:gamma-glutamylcyclotransferase n=1 Tax=Gymnodinialimonas mytili TaxID=3126503 RepID=UPI0030AB68A5
MSQAPVVLFGTLCHKPLLDLVAGKRLETQPAMLPDNRATWVQNRAWPMLVPERGAVAEGLLIRPGADTLARLDFYEACFDYHRAPVEILVDGTVTQAQAWKPRHASGQPGADWSLADWARDWGPISVAAAAEVMRQLGREDPRRVGARFGIIRSRAQSRLTTSAWHRPGHVGGQLTRADVISHRAKHLHDGFFCAEDATVTHRRFDGSVSGDVNRGVTTVADAVTILPYDPVRDAILVVEQLRMGPLTHGDPAPWMLEPIAGMVDAGETAEQSGRREAIEEANLTLGEMHFIARYYPSPGGLGQVFFSYLAIADLPEDATGTGGHPDEAEDIQSHIIPFDLAKRMLEEGDMANAVLIVSMQYLLLHRDRLRAAASG